MILVRNVFRLKFGKAKEGVATFKELVELAKRLGFPGKSRLLTDLVGDFYTIVFEHTFDSLAAFESSAGAMMGKPEWQTAYAKLVPLIESGHREVFNVVAE
jgi:hypothetical protein